MDVTACQHEINVLSSRLNYLRDVVQQQEAIQTTGSSLNSFPSPPDSPPHHVRPSPIKASRSNYSDGRRLHGYHGVLMSGEHHVPSVYSYNHQPLTWYRPQSACPHDIPHETTFHGHARLATAREARSPSIHGSDPPRIQSTASMRYSHIARDAQCFSKLIRKLPRIAPAPPKSQSPPALQAISHHAVSHPVEVLVEPTFSYLPITPTVKPAKRGREDDLGRRSNSRPSKLALSQPHAIGQIDKCPHSPPEDSSDEDVNEVLQVLVPNDHRAGGRRTSVPNDALQSRVVDLTSTPDIIDLTSKSKFVLVRPQSFERNSVKAPKRVPLKWREGVQELLTAIPGPSMWKKRLEHSGLTDILHGERFARFFLENTLGVNRGLQFPSTADLDLICAHKAYAGYDPSVKRIMCGVYTYSYMTAKEKVSAKAGTMDRTLVEFRTMLLLASCAVLKAHAIPEELLFAMLQPAYGKAKPDHYRRMMRVAVWLTRLVDMLELLEVEELATELLLLCTSFEGAFWAIETDYRCRGQHFGVLSPIHCCRG